MANKAYKYRAYPTPEQEALIQQTFGCCRKVWNLMLADKIAHFEQTGKMLYNTPAQYKAEYPYLKEVDSLALANVQLQLQQAFKNFFQQPKTGFPKWKSKKHPKRSYTTNSVNGNIRVEGGFIRLPKLGWVKAKIHRKIPKHHRIKSVTVSQNAAGRYFVSVLTEYAADVKPVALDTPSAIGLDYSSPEFYVGTDGTPEHPHPYHREQARLAFEQRKLSRMQPGSNNYRKQQLRIGRIHQRIADIRRDFLAKTSTEIANRFDVVGIENLNMQAQAQALSFGKAVADNGWGMFTRMLEYKLEERRKYLVKADRLFPSTKTCHECGHRNPDVVLGVREWTCPECGSFHLRDENAALNLRDYALAALGVAPLNCTEPQGLRG